jgi:hypothetical protein
MKILVMPGNGFIESSVSKWGVPCGTIVRENGKYYERGIDEFAI